MIFVFQVRYNEKTLLMEVYLHQTVVEFKRCVQKFTGLLPSQQRLFYNEMLDGQIIHTQELRLPNKTLLSLNVNDGDGFEICEK